MTTTGTTIVPLRSAALRWTIAAALVAAAAVAAVGVVRSAVAETVLAVSRRRPLPAVALDRAHAYEPDNPETSYRLALYYMDSAQPPDFDAAARLLDEALALAPERPATWLALGRHRELTDRAAEAERAYLHAASLVPQSWRPQWVLGNLYVREGRIDDGIGALRLACDRNTDIVALAIQTVWRATDGDLDATARTAGEGLRGRSDLVQFLLQQQRTDAALPTWRDLARAYPDGANVSDYGRQLAGQLLGAGRIDDALEVWATVSPGAAPAPERVQNGGFEDQISDRAESPFTWAISQSPEARVSLDAGRSGAKALRVDYRVKGTASFVHAVEYVRVRPGASYTLGFWAKTADLQSGGLPTVGVADASTREPMSASRSLAAGTSEWTEVRIPFRAPSSGLVAVRVERASCGDLCPIFGTIWIDDLALVAN